METHTHTKGVGSYAEASKVRFLSRARTYMAGSIQALVRAYGGSNQ